MPIVGNGMITLGMSNSQAHFNQYYKEYLQTQSLHDKTKLNTVVVCYCHFVQIRKQYQSANDLTFLRAE